MKRLFALTAVMLLMIGSATASAEKPVICNFQGTWLGYNIGGDAQLMVTANGQSFSNGTYVVQMPGINMASFGFAGIGATGRGTWARTGFKTFVVTFITIAVDPTDGKTLGIARVDGTDTLSDDCNSMEIEGKISIFYNPKANPFVDEPDFGPSSLGPHGQVIRMPVKALD